MKKTDIIFIGFVGIFLMFAVFVIGSSINFGGGGSTGGSRVIKAENKTNVIDTAIGELKSMELLELIDLKERIIDFKNYSSFNFDVSGILEVFK